MNAKRLIALLSATIALGALGTAAHAETQDDMSFSGMFKMDRIDKNKDGMVSKTEFLEAMSKVWDMKVEEMKVEGDRMNGEDYKQVLMYLKAGS